jgi:4-amino-4-deoxy-L-arabinose transferase-like glycosyltransferase
VTVLDLSGGSRPGMTSNLDQAIGAPRAQARQPSSAPVDDPAMPLALVGIVGVSVILRLLSAIWQGDAIDTLPGVFDQVSYDTLARRVLAGAGFTMPTNWWPGVAAGEPTAHWSYLYTLYLSAVYAIFGGHALPARVIQAVVVGILHPWLAWRIGSRVFGSSVGLVAAGLTAIYGYFVFYAGALVTEAFFIVAVLWMLDLATAMASTSGARSQAEGFRSRLSPGSAKPWLLLGLAIGLAALLRQVVLLFVPVLFAWLLWATCRQQATRSDWSVGDRWRAWRVVGGLLLSVVVVVALIVPWTARNYAAFGRFVPLNTNAGYAFFWANHPIHGTDFVAILPDGTYRDLIPAELRGLDEAALDAALMRLGIGFVVDDPVRYARLSLSRASDYFQFWASAESGLMSNLVRVFSFGVLWPFMVYGMLVPVAFRRRFTDSAQGAAIVLLYLFAAVYSAIHLLSWALIRYRLPVDAVLLPFAAVAIVDLAARLPTLAPNGRTLRPLAKARDRA